MRRPLTIIGFTALFSLITAPLIALNAVAAIGMLGLLMGTALFCIPETRKYVIISVACLTVGASCLYFFVKTVITVQPVTALEGYTAEISGRVTELPENNGDRYYYVVETDSIELQGAPQKVKVRLFSNENINIDPFDDLTGQVTFYSPSENMKNRYAARGIYILGFFNEYPTVTQTDQKPVYYYAIQIRTYIKELTNANFTPEISGLIQGILLGDTSGLEQADIESFRRAGISHLLSVSGAHLAIVIQFLLFILGSIGLKRRISAGISIFAVVLFMAVTGFPFSMVRAGIMYIIYLSAQVVRRESDSLNSLAFALLCIILYNPFSASDVGLMLSGSATLGIVLLSGKLNNLLLKHLPGKNKIPGFCRFLCTSLAQSLSAIFFITPVSILAFGSVSVVAPFANLLATAAVSAMLGMMVLAVLFSLSGFLAFIYNPLMLLSGLLAKYILFIGRFFGSLFFSSAAINYKYISVWLGCTLLLIGLAFLLRRDFKMIRITALLSCFILLCGAVSYSVFDSGVTRIAVMDVGNGSAVLLYKSGHGVLIGCGGDRYTAGTVQQFLKDHNVKQLDTVILPNLEDLYAAGAYETIRTQQPELVVMQSEGKYHYQLSAIQSDEVRFQPLDNQVITVLDGITIDVLNREDGVMIATQIGDTRVLISYPSADLRNLPENHQNPDLLLCTTAVPQSAKECDPEFAVVSGDEQYGTAAAAKLASQGVVSYSTSGAGNIIIQTRGMGDLKAGRE